MEGCDGDEVHVEGKGEGKTPTNEGERQAREGGTRGEEDNRGERKGRSTKLVYVITKHP